MISELENVIQAYAWGSHSALALLRGAPHPTERPEAELWMGAHPLAPSRIKATGATLGAVIEAAPAEHLGQRVQ